MISASACSCSGPLRLGHADLLRDPRVDLRGLGEHVLYLTVVVRQYLDHVPLALAHGLRTSGLLIPRRCLPKSRLHPMRGLKRDRSLRIVAAGHAFIQNVRRGHYELATDARALDRVAVAFGELMPAI